MTEVCTLLGALVVCMTVVLFFAKCFGDVFLPIKN